MMSGKHNKRSWSEEEIECLHLGHSLGATVKTLSIVLNRTESSLSKALSRLGIRQYGATPRGQKPRAKRLSAITPEKLRQEMIDFVKKKRVLDITFSSNGLGNNIHPSSLMIFPNPLLNFPKRKKPVPLSIWLDLDQVIALLKRRGHKISRNGEPSLLFQNFKAEFLMDGIPQTTGQLLMHANRARIEQGLEAFYVENVTEH